MYDQFAHYYDLTHADLTEDLDFILALARQTGGAVLELGCGSGRVLLPLSRAGHMVTGVDNSTAMLARARAHLAAETRAVQSRVTLVEADMAELALAGQNGRFSLAIIPYNTFMHLDSAQKTASLQRIGDYLGENGRLFIDLINPLAIAQTANDQTLTLENSFTDPETGHTVLQMTANQLDEAAQILYITWVYDATPAAGGPVHRAIARAAYHYLYPHQIELLLHETGFKLESLAGSYDHAPFTEESERILITAVHH